MRKLTLTLAALTLSASTAMAAGPGPKPQYQPLLGWFGFSLNGVTECGDWNTVGVVGFDGAGHIVNDPPPNSAWIRTTFVPLASSVLPASCKAQQSTSITSTCEYNIMSPSATERPGTNLTVIASDSALRMPVKYLQFQTEPPLCNAAGTISTFGGVALGRENGLFKTTLNVGGSGTAAGFMTELGTN